MASQQLSIKGRKTRTGCLQCKRRRVKCDETKPRCRNCTRLGLQCSFYYSTPKPLLPQGEDATNTSHGISTAASSIYTVDDMRLLHQFTSSTAFTVADGTEVQQTWKGSVIELAFDHTFLLHSILAFSALHMAHLHPQDKAIHGNVAARHQDKALSEVHSEIANITAHNCEALLAFSLLTVCYIPASKEASSDAPSAEICALFEWLNLIRGVVSVVNRGKRWIQTGSLAIWLKFFLPDLTGFAPFTKTSLEDDHKLRCLEELWDSISFDEMAECTHSDAQIEAALCKEALAQLRGAFSLAEVASFAGGKGSGATPNDEQYSSVVAASLIWLYQISDGFLRMILARRPSALILLLHNFILVKRLGGEKCWWAPLLAIQVFDAVTPLIPSKYNAFILWPVEEIRGSDQKREL